MEHLLLFMTFRLTSSHCWKFVPDIRISPCEMNLKVMKYSVTYKKRNTGFPVATPFLLQTGANSALKAKVHFAQVMSYQVFTEAESGGVNLNSEGSVHPVQGSLQWNSPSQSHIKGLPEISMGLDRGWEIHDGNHSLGCAHGGGEERHWKWAVYSSISSLYIITKLYTDNF